MAAIVKKPGAKGKPNYYVVYTGTDGRQKWKTAGKRRKDAEVLKAKIEHGLHTGTHVEDTNHTIEDLAQRFVEVQRARVRERTLESYSGHFKRILPFFASRKLKAIRPLDVEEFLAHLEREGMSAPTRAKHLQTLKTTLKRACQWGWIGRNPAEYVKPPRIQRSERDFLSPEEIERLIGATDPRFRVLMMCACFTGMRQGELLALQWGDIDFESSRVFVRRTWQRNRFYEPKTQSSRRAVVVPPVLIDALKIHQAEQAVNLEQNPLELLFPSETGLQPLDHAAVYYRAFRPALKRAGLRQVRFHDLRHSYAAIMVSRGENIKFVQKQLGHANIQMTMNVYAHLLPETEAEAPARLEAVLSARK